MEDAGMLTLLFLCVLTLLGKWLFRVEDWGKIRKKPRKPIGKVRMDEYRRFHERHGQASSAGERWRERVKRGEFRIDP